MQNGNEPLITCVTGSHVAPLTANRLSPTGGMTLPISMHSAVNMPRCTGSMPSERATGK